MSSFLISLLVALGAGTWVYTKVMKSSGGLTKNAIIVAAGCALVLFIVILTLLNSFL